MVSIVAWRNLTIGIDTYSRIGSGNRNTVCNDRDEMMKNSEFSYNAEYVCCCARVLFTARRVGFI